MSNARIIAQLLLQLRLTVPYGHCEQDQFFKKVSSITAAGGGIEKARYGGDDALVVSGNCGRAV
jgi:hypothetical protein